MQITQAVSEGQRTANTESYSLLSKLSTILGWVLLTCDEPQRNTTQSLQKWQQQASAVRMNHTGVITALIL